MKILSAAQTRLADQQTIAQEHIDSIRLMERAAAACMAYLQERHTRSDRYIVICGKGNNGGDGLAIARMLIHAGYEVAIYILEYTDSSSPDFLANLDLLISIPEAHITHVRQLADLKIDSDTNTILIDAILGTGINKPTKGLIAEVIGQVNKVAYQIIAIDVPSGLPVDAPMPEDWSVVRAKVTLTFQQPKLAFMFPESGAYTGDLEVLDIGLDRAFISSLDTDHYFLQEADITAILRQRTKFSNKGTFGHSLIIAGAYGKMGAAVLASHAALCSGTGLLTTHIPACGYQIIQTALPEAMISIDKNPEEISHLPELGAYSSIGIGPGIGQHSNTAKLVKDLLTHAKCPLIIDADALNILSTHREWLDLLPDNTIITPHPKEFDRLTEKHDTSWQRLEAARTMANTYNIYVVLKGAYTAIVSPDRTVLFNSTGNPALAKGGTGDVLTGIITALLSRGYAPHEAAFLGVYLHGLAADIAVCDIHAEALIASDVISHLSDAFMHLYEG